MGRPFIKFRVTDMPITVGPAQGWLNSCSSEGTLLGAPLLRHGEGHGVSKLAVKAKNWQPNSPKAIYVAELFDA
jgi:hypothetical protein